MSAIELAPASAFRPELSEFLRSFPAAELGCYEWLTADPAANVAVAEGAVVGAAVLSLEGIHLRRSWAAVLVGPAWRRRGVGTALYAELLSRSPVPLRAKVPVTDGAARSFCDAVGTATLVRSHLVLVPASSVLVDVRLPPGLQLEPIRVPPEPDVLGAVVALYERVHGWDPPAPGSGAAIASAFAGDVCFGTAAVRDGAIVGIAVAHADAGSVPAEGSVVEAAMVGSLEPDAPGAPITTALLGALLDRGFDVEVEVDEGLGGHDELLDVLRRIEGCLWRPATLIVGSA